MAPRLVSPSPGRQVRKVGIKNSCTRRTRWARGGGGLPVEQTGFADRDLFILDEYTSRCGAVGARLVLLGFKSLALPGATLRKVWAAWTPPAFCKSFGEHSCLQRAAGGLPSAEAGSTHSNCCSFWFWTSMDWRLRRGPAP